MKNIIEAFAPSGDEDVLRQILIKKIRGKFDEISVDNMGNLIARVGKGGLCIECGMDNIGVMAVSIENGHVRISPVGEFRAKDAVGKRVVFENGSCGVICNDEEKTDTDMKFADLYLKMDSAQVKIGDFGMIFAEYEEDEYAFSGYNLGNRIGLAAVCEALKKTDEPINTTIVFSAQKRLGGRGLNAYFKANTFDRIVTVDKSQEDGCTIVAKDARAVSNRDLRIRLERIADKEGVFSETVVSKQNFYLEQISVSCGDPCCAVGIEVMSECGEKDRVCKCDFDAAVSLLTGLLKSEA